MNKITKGVVVLAATSTIVTSLAGSADAAKVKRQPFTFDAQVLCSEARPDDGHNVLNIDVNNLRKNRIKVHIKIEDFDTAPFSSHEFDDVVYGKYEIATDDHIELALRVYYEYGTHVTISRMNGTVLYSKSFYDEGCAHN